MRDDTKELLRLTEALLSEEALLKFETVAIQYARRMGVPLRDALDLMDSRWRVLMRHMRRRDHYVITTTTQDGVNLGLEGIASLTDDKDIRRCVPGNGNGSRAVAFLLASSDEHVMFIAEYERLAAVSTGVQRTAYGQLADATVQGVVSENGARELLKQQPKHLSLSDLKQIGVERLEADSA